MRSATASATVVLPTPPGPTIVVSRWRGSREASAATVSSRPIIRNRERQIVQRCWRARRGQGSLRLLLEGDRRNEIVATSRNSDDITLAALPVTESAAQSADLNLQICLFDESLRPSSGDQFFLRGHLASAFDSSR